MKRLFLISFTVLLVASVFAIAKSSTEEEHRSRITQCKERCKALKDPNPECAHHCELLP